MEGNPPCILFVMEIEGIRARRTVAGPSPTECRACPVICERVVSPVHCLRSGCRFAYVFEQDGTLYFGCVEKVFSAELDLGPYQAGSRKDPYGVLRAVRKPLPECRQYVERAYEFLYSRRTCENPTFAHHPSDYSPDAVRRMVHGVGVSGPRAPAEESGACEMD